MLLWAGNRKGLKVGRQQKFLWRRRNGSLSLIPCFSLWQDFPPSLLTTDSGGLSIPSEGFKVTKDLSQREKGPESLWAEFPVHCCCVSMQLPEQGVRWSVQLQSCDVGLDGPEHGTQQRKQSKAFRNVLCPLECLTEVEIKVCINIWFLIHFKNELWYTKSDQNFWLSSYQELGLRPPFLEPLWVLGPFGQWSTGIMLSQISSPGIITITSMLILITTVQPTSQPPAGTQLGRPVEADPLASVKLPCRHRTEQRFSNK